MSANRLAELAFKIWGVVMVVGALASLPVGLLVSLGNDGMNGSPRAAVAATVISIVMQAVAGIALALLSGRTIIARAWWKLRAARAVDGDTEADDFGEDDSL